METPKVPQEREDPVLEKIILTPEQPVDVGESTYMFPWQPRRPQSPVRKKDLAHILLSPQLLAKDEVSNCSEATVTQSLPSSSNKQSPLQKQITSFSSDKAAESEDQGKNGKYVISVTGKGVLPEPKL